MHPTVSRSARALFLAVLFSACGGADAQSGPQARTASSDADAPTRRARVVDIAAGEQHTLAVRDDGSVWTWGLSGNGQLGRAVTIDDYWLPKPVDGLQGLWTEAGGAFSYVYDGERLWSAGYNPIGYLGYGPTEDEVTFTARPFPGLVDLEAWGSTTLALMADSTVRSWGSGVSGELGIGTTPRVQVEPVPIPGLDRIIAIASGGQFSMALRADGTVWTWGSNGSATLGTPDVPNGLIRATTAASGAVSVGGPGSQHSTVSAVPIQARIDRVIAIAAGGSHALAVRDDGTVWGWGANQRGALAGADYEGGYVDPVWIEGLTEVVAVAAGVAFSLALKADGSLWMWGHINGMYNDPEPYHRLRQVPGLPAIAWIEAGHWHAFAVGEDGRVWGWGLTDQGQVGAEGTGREVEWPPLPVRFNR